jgi:hypothetical protein
MGKLLASPNAFVMRPARMLGWIFLFAFGAILFTLLFDPEERISPLGAVALFAVCLPTGLNETWGNFLEINRTSIRRIHWAGVTYQDIPIPHITSVHREDERTWHGRVTPIIVVDSTATQIRLPINVYYRDGGWPFLPLAQAIVELARLGAPVDEIVLRDALDATL